MKIYFVILEVQFYHERGLQLNSHVNCRIQMDVWIFTLVSSSVHLSKIVTAPSLCPRLSPQWLGKHRYNTEQEQLFSSSRGNRRLRALKTAPRHWRDSRWYWRRGSKSTERPNSGTAAASLCYHPTSLFNIGFFGFLDV